jgi:broad specificity phosphatase PhoE
MINRILQLSLFASFFIFLSACTQSAGRLDASDGADPLLVFLVRHAEKVDHSRDADLSPEGYERAQELARVLSDAGIQKIYSTDYTRTRETAKPLADQLEKEIILYDARELYALAKELRDGGGRYLVVGHSNTTPALVEILGGEPGIPILEETEYDRLYVLSIKGKEVQSALLRYGRPCSSAPSKHMASSRLVPHTSGSALN